MKPPSACSTSLHSAAEDGEFHPPPIALFLPPLIPVPGRLPLPPPTLPPLRPVPGLPDPPVPGLPDPAVPGRLPAAEQGRPIPFVQSLGLRLECCADVVYKVRHWS